MMEIMMVAVLGLVLMATADKNDTAAKVLRSKVSSAYTRIVGEVRIDLFNTKQTTDLPKKAYTKKWALIVAVGKRVRVADTFARKYDGIAQLRILEAEMMAENES